MILLYFLLFLTGDLSYKLSLIEVLFLLKLFLKKVLL